MIKLCVLKFLILCTALVFSFSPNAANAQEASQLRNIEAINIVQVDPKVSQRLINALKRKLRVQFTAKVTSETYPIRIGKAFNRNLNRVHVNTLIRLDDIKPSEPGEFQILLTSATLYSDTQRFTYFHIDHVNRLIVISIRPFRAYINTLNDPRLIFDVMSSRLYKTSAKTLAMSAGLFSNDCVMADITEFKHIDRINSEFCPDDRFKMIEAGILRPDILPPPIQ